MKRLLFVLCLALLALAALPAFAQQPPMFDQAVADLSARAGRALTTEDFASYAWAQDVYPDTSFGCATPPSEVSPGPVSGYVITITFEGVTYDYRASADGSILFLCSESGQGEQPASTPAPGTPEAVDDCPTGFVGYLPPRLTVGTDARVADGEAPNRLRSAPSTSAQQIGLLQPGEEMEVVGGPACADGYVWWQVRAGTLTGWTVEGALPDTYYLEPVGGAGTAATPNAGAVPQFATVQQNAIALWELGVDSLIPVGEILTPAMTNNGYVAQIVFSPDGETLAFRLVDFPGGQMVNSVYVADAAAGAVPQLVAEGLFTEMPVSFTPDGALLYAVEDVERGMVELANSEAGGSGVIAQVFQQALTDGAAPEQIYEFGFGVGCGGGWSYPAVGAYNAETGYGGRPLILALTDYGLVYSTNCTGSGVRIYDANSPSEVKNNEVGMRLSRAVVSPDGTQIAGTEDEQAGFGPGTLTIIDLATLEGRTLATAAEPAQIAWTPDGQIIYSSAAETGDIVPGSTGEAFVNMGFAAGIPARAVTIAQLDPETGAELVLYTGPGYQVGKLLPLPGGDLVFSVIPAGEDWIAAVTDGTLPTDGNNTTLFMNYFVPVIYRLPAISETAVPIGAGFQSALNAPALASG